MAINNEAKHNHATIGSAKNFWLFSSKTGFDLTHPPTPSSPPISPRVTIKTTTTPITIDPLKSGLVIIDMQNFFLSPAFGRAKGAGHAALEQLVKYAIPAARRAGIRIIWLNWGLTDEELDDIPPAVTRAFGFEGWSNEDRQLAEQAKGTGIALDRHGSPRHHIGHALEDGKQRRKYRGVGSECGAIKDPNTGDEIDAGKLLVRGAWNAALYSPLDVIYEEGSKLSQRPDVWIHKNRMSGMWGYKSACEEFLEQEGIRTLFFTGVNTDQCVGGTYTDSFSKGYDCILLNDGAATTSPEYAQHCFQYNAANTWGFATTCEALAEGVDVMLK